MLDKKIEEFIQDNGLVRVQASPMSEAFDVWECPGGHVWTFEMIEKKVKDEITKKLDLKIARMNVQIRNRSWQRREQNL